MKSNVFKTPLGWVGVAVSDRGICRMVLPKKDKKTVERELESPEVGASTQRLRVAPRVQGARSSEQSGLTSLSVLAKAVKLLQKYFSGRRVLFDLPLDTRSHTPFQQAVWQAAAKIPPGETRSYAWIAKKIKNPRAVRAVGQALGANPIPIIIPCHRVITSAGTLGGYAGGLSMKKGLLELEARKAGS